MEQLVVLLAITAALEPSTLEQNAPQLAVADMWRISELADQFARRHTTEEQRRFVGNAALITRIIVEKKVVYELSF